MRLSASLASFMSGVGALSHPRAVWALVIAPATGWLTSCAIDAVICPWWRPGPRAPMPPERPDNAARSREPRPQRACVGQIDNKSEPFQSPLVESGETDQDRDARAIFAQVFLLEWQHGPGRVDLRCGLGIATRPSGGERKLLLSRPAARSSRSYPTMRRKASLASTMAASPASTFKPLTFHV